MTRPQARTDLTVVDLDDEAVVFDPDTGQLHRLNSTGRTIFSLCDGTATVAELAADIAELYGLPCEEVETQVDTLLSGLQAAGLLEDARSRGPGGGDSMAPAAESTVEQPLPPAGEPPARHLHTKRRGNP